MPKMLSFVKCFLTKGKNDNPSLFHTMNHLLDYKTISDDEEDLSSMEPNQSDPVNHSTNLVSNKGLVVHKTLDLAPMVNTELSRNSYLTKDQKEVFYNPKYELMSTPVQTVDHPFYKASNQSVMRGVAHKEVLDDMVFDKAYHSYVYAEEGLGSKKKRKRSKEEKQTYDPSNVDVYTGSWGEGLRMKEKMMREIEERKSQEKEDDVEREKMKVAEAEERQRQKEQDEISDMNRSIFHGASIKDANGRSWMEPPKHLKEKSLVEPVKTEALDPELAKMIGGDGSNKKIYHQLQGTADVCYIPKKRMNEWSHTKAVSAVRFFPKIGHLLLSATLDGTIKIYDVLNKKKCMLTYLGHQQGVKDICFTEDGTKFISCSFDKFVRYWDTETGKCIAKYTTDRVPYCLKFYPEGEPQTQFLVGQQDKRIVQWDIRENEIVQEYDRHLAAVNTITFIDENRRFVTTSDDKSIRVWDYGIPVDIQYIAEPYMHSMPAVTVHPSKKYVLCQSLDNRILVYSAGDRFSLHKKKVFSGHTVAGYACRVGVSNDGRFVMSGDSSGNIWFWNWKTTKILTKFKAHDKVVIDCEWHPLEPSKVATGSWDGLVKYWD